jgi:hypothetical protein
MKLFFSPGIHVPVISSPTLRPKLHRHGVHEGTAEPNARPPGPAAQGTQKYLSCPTKQNSKLKATADNDTDVLFRNMHGTYTHSFVSFKKIFFFLPSFSGSW